MSKEPSNKNGLKRKRVGVACSNCQNSHLSCDNVRPCNRCARKGIGHLCVDGVQRRRGKKPRNANYVPNPYANNYIPQHYVSGVNPHQPYATPLNSLPQIALAPNVTPAHMAPASSPGMAPNQTLAMPAGVPQNSIPLNASALQMAPSPMSPGMPMSVSSLSPTQLYSAYVMAPQQLRPTMGLPPSAGYQYYGYDLPPSSTPAPNELQRQPHESSAAPAAAPSLPSSPHSSPSSSPPRSQSHLPNKSAFHPPRHEDHEQRAHQRQHADPRPHHGRPHELSSDELEETSFTRHSEDEQEGEAKTHQFASPSRPASVTPPTSVGEGVSVSSSDASSRSVSSPHSSAVSAPLPATAAPLSASPPLPNGTSSGPSPTSSAPTMPISATSTPSNHLHPQSGPRISLRDLYHTSYTFEERDPHQVPLQRLPHPHQQPQPILMYPNQHPLVGQSNPGVFYAPAPPHMSQQQFRQIQIQQMMSMQQQPYNARIYDASGAIVSHAPPAGVATSAPGVASEAAVASAPSLSPSSMRQSSGGKGEDDDEALSILCNLSQNKANQSQQLHNAHNQSLQSIPVPYGDGQVLYHRSGVAGAPTPFTMGMVSMMPVVESYYYRAPPPQIYHVPHHQQQQIGYIAQSPLTS